MKNTDNIQLLKLQMIVRYLQLMMIILLFYSIAFFMGGLNRLIVVYTFFGSAIFGCLIYLAFRIPFQKVLSYVRIYLFLAPLYNLYFFIILFSISVGNVVWLLPMSLGAFILYSKKEAIMYAAYSVLLIVIGIIVSSNFGEYFNEVNSKFRPFISFIEITAFLFNGTIIMMFIRYKDKINIIKNQEQQSIVIDKKDTPDKKLMADIIRENEEDYLAFFKILDEKMTHEKWFKDANLNISKICIDLNTNATYVSRAIRAKGYTHFNHYLNSIRVNYVKILLKEKDLSKVTLLYIYTEAGFSNQPTFNRVFKQIEGVTPSEYIKEN
ncbi:MAG: AraC family transcriptional regulator [Chryseobacterium sp.]|uniref:helix-turn-helix domain-containing protein n=1 Tax=Chryseobacterium sp. TaxID=1871047 RepID=UPI0025BD2162|nr:AraC family transcriptional regulator [Chryseobacterium sp.]MCJ7933447.1 AraC family transcriptional regulator [Chryseobacterium sp.]